ncbi:MAG TPA: serine hydrolase domain-containing protein [Candidatus Bathyarchaeia archaeon]|nr:serine hydrolase domain-containing protein [Candidatus Bathyarchaeia archaeon]
MVAWLLAILMLVLATPAFAVVDCRGATPLPADLRIVPPSADLPAGLAAFAGGWNGFWKDPTGAGDLCNTLVVEEVLADGHARIVYSVGWAPKIGSGSPNFFRATGRIAGDVLTFRVPEPGRPLLLKYRLDGDKLAGTFQESGTAELTRAADVQVFGCRPPGQPVRAPSGTRDRLTAAQLMAPVAEGSVSAPVHNDYFMPIRASRPPRRAFRGVITVPDFSVVPTRLGCSARPVKSNGFTAAFFTEGDRLVPTNRDILPQSHVILSPGRVWSEPGDGGLSRASFPFIVVNDVNNGTQNGIATFVYDRTRVSSLALQIVQETMPWAKLDMAARIAITYTPGPIANEAALRAEFQQELARQLPMKPWSALPASPLLAAFDGDARPEEISANGLVMDGVLYVKGCHTRYGPFPYCREMRHGVFSVTKSAAGAVALLRLAQKYGDGVLDEKIADYLPPGVATPPWDGVTFADALSMATGVGDEKPTREPNDPFADENRPKLFSFLLKRTAAEKLAVAMSYGKYPWGRNEVFRYNSTQTFLLAVAMDTYLKRKEGPDAHLWDMVVNEVFVPIGIFHAPMMHSLETGGARGVPLLGYGLYPTVDDAAKIAMLFQSGGKHDGVQILSAAKVAEATFRADASVGLPNVTARNRYGEGRYRLSFWSIPYRTATGCPFQIPHMTGYGGNLIALLPNGVTVFRFADAFNFDLDSMILAGESLKPFCAPPATATADLLRTPLTATELLTSFIGKGYVTGVQKIVFAPGGRLLGSMPDDQDVGTWEISADARVCRTWNAWDGRRQRCYVVYRKDDGGWDLDIPERLTRFTLRPAD